MEGFQNWLVSLSADYSVDPWIFGILYIGGIPLFFLVVGWLAKRAKDGKSVALQALLLLYLAIQPYLYVALFGENLPGWVYAALGALVLLGAWQTYGTVQKRKKQSA
jgi:hypothetical protein